MPVQDAIARAFAIVDRALRSVFPKDFDQRCMYAAFGLRAVLKDAGLIAEIVGGDFLCLVIAADNSRATLQGFGTSASKVPSHFWVEVNGCLIDMGPHYLPLGSSFAAMPMPLIRWSLANVMPPFLRYRAHMRYHSDVELQADDAIMGRMHAFLAQCHECSCTEVHAEALPTWQLKDLNALRFAAHKGDRWARGALTYMQRFSPSTSTILRQSRY